MDSRDGGTLRGSASAKHTNMINLHDPSPHPLSIQLHPATKAQDGNGYQLTQFVFVETSRNTVSRIIPLLHLNYCFQ